MRSKRTSSGLKRTKKISETSSTIKENAFSIELDSLVPPKGDTLEQIPAEGETNVEGTISDWKLTKDQLDYLYKLIMPHGVGKPTASNLIKTNFTKNSFKKFAEITLKGRHGVYCLYGLGVIKDDELRRETLDLAEQFRKKHPKVEKINMQILKEWVGSDESKKSCVIFAANAYEYEEDLV